MRERSNWVTPLQPRSRNDYDLTPVPCPGTYTGKFGDELPCGKLIDRREVKNDRAVHEYRCPGCLCLYTYHFNDGNDLVVLSLLKPPPRQRGGSK